MPGSRLSHSLGMAIALMSFPVFFLLPDSVFGIPEATIMVVVFVLVSAILRYEGLPRASIGYLLVAVSGSILLVIGLKNDPVAIVAFFGLALAGFGFVISEAIHEVEARSAG